MRVLGPCGGAAQLPAHAPCAAAPVPPLRSALRCLDITQSGCTLATCLALQCHHSRITCHGCMDIAHAHRTALPMPLGTRARGHFLSFPLYNLRNADRTREIGNREVHPARAGRLLFIRVSDDEGRPPRSRQPAWGRVLLALEWHRRAKCYEMQNPARVRTHGKRGAGVRLGRPARTRRAAMALGKGSPRHILKRTAGLAE